MIKQKLNNWVIYKITSPTNRIYIGRTSNFNTRKCSYKRNACKQQRLLYNSLCKYEYNNHKIEILETFDSSIAHANERETFWIAYYKTNVNRWPDFKGLNLTDGGDGTLGIKRSDEQKRKHSEFMKGKVSWNKGIVVPQETKIKISKALMGRPSLFKGVKNRMSAEGKEKTRAVHLGNTYCLGRKASEETKVKLRNSHLGNTSRNRAIVHYDKHGVKLFEYPSIIIAASKIGITRKMIHLYLKGEVKNPRHIFKYAA